MKRIKARRLRKRLLAAAWLHACLALPVLALAVDKHPPTPTDQDCVECHAKQAEIWLSGKHGLMNVKCVVCHGDPKINFSRRTTMVKCRGCHPDQVQDVQTKRRPGKKGCFLCHDHHTVAPKPAAAADNKGFHKGGAK